MGVAKSRDYGCPSLAQRLLNGSLLSASLMFPIRRLVIALLFAACAPLLRATPDLSGGRLGHTPYDRYMKPVTKVLRQLNGAAPDFNRVASLVRTSYGFDYVFDTPYVAATPEETEARHAGDCKAKSLWLAKQMNDRSIRFVIGKARAGSKLSHAWLLWKNGGRWWILDPTNASQPIPADQVSQDEYLVTYSYDRAGSHVYPVAYFDKEA